MSSPQWVLYFIFFLSGATGLVYEVIWVRLTGLVFGNTSHAIATVLGAFMAGLALGSWKLGRRADQTANPLRTYGILEIGIGISAALVPLAFQALESFYWAVAPQLAPIPGANGAARFLASFLVMLVPTFLMGGTLPMLTRFFTRSLSEVERKVGVLYALNTFGAAVGTLAAALYLIPELGNTTTTLIIAALNLAIGGLAIWLSGRATVAREVDMPPQPARPAGDVDGNVMEQPVEANAATDRLVLITLAASGFISMVYEVAWSRALTALIGSSTYAFSIMLVTFLVGIALGSSLVSRFRPAASIRVLGLMQLGIAAGAVVFLVGYLAAPYIILALIRGLFYSFPAVLATQFLVCALLMIFATLCMGATFPIASQLYSSKFVVLGRSIGNMYSLNTIGAIAGSLLAGFLLLPLIGTERTIIAGLFFNSAVAFRLLSDKFSTARLSRWVALGLLVVATLSMRGGYFWNPDTLDRGILIYAQQFAARPELTITEQYQDTDVVFFDEGNNATISVRRGEGYVALRTNGKVDASNRDDMKSQLMFGYLPAFFHQAPRSALVVGYGSGVTVGAATTFTELEEIDCIEIEPAVLGAASHFDTINRKSYGHPKVRIIYDDARSYMNVTRKQYDLIISEPSNPWIAGVASLFTAEFYQRAAEVLKPDGVFAQWVQLYELDPEDLRMILREFQQTFPEVSLWHTGAADLILIGTRQPQRLDLGRVSRIALADPTIMRDFRDYFHLSRPEGILAYYVLPSDVIRGLSSTSRRNTDDHPILEYHAPRMLFKDTGALNIDMLYDAKSGLIPPGAVIVDPEITYSAMVEPLLALGREDLANQAVDLLAQVERREEASLHVAMARVNLETGNLSATETSLTQAAELIRPGSSLMGEFEELWGLMYDASGAAPQAMQHFERAVAADPNRDISLRRLAELNAQNKSWEAAAMWMERFLQTEPMTPAHYWAVLGDYYFSLQKSQEGLNALNTALMVDPYNFWAHRRYAQLQEDSNDIEGAIQRYEFIMKYAYDRDPEVYNKLASLYMQSARPEDAEETLRKGVRIFSRNVAIYKQLRSLQDVE
jgi:spermidine synthase